MPQDLNLLEYDRLGDPGRAEIRLDASVRSPHAVTRFARSLWRAEAPKPAP